MSSRGVLPRRCNDSVSDVPGLLCGRSRANARGILAFGEGLVGVGTVEGRAGPRGGLKAVNDGGLEGAGSSIGVDTGGASGCLGGVCVNI